MNKLWAITLLGLAGCNVNINPNVATPNQVIIAANAYNAAEVSATNYLRLPLCGVEVKTTCRTQAISQSIVNAVRAGRTARRAVLADLQTNTTIPLTLLQTLSAAVVTMQSVGGI